MAEPDVEQSPGRPLLQLAERYGVVPDHWDYHGGRHVASDATLVAVLASLGVDASSPERVELALANADDDPWRHMLPPIVVLREGTSAQVPVHVDHGQSVAAWIELDEEVGGGRRPVSIDVEAEPRTVDGRLVGRANVEIPADLPLGWHALSAQSGESTAVCAVVVAPVRLEVGHGLLERRGWGFMTQLYSVRSEQSWGIGDFADLRDLGWLAARQCGADFVLVNPLHAAESVAPLTPSPYLPSTRRFVNPIYLRVEDIPETGYLSAAERTLVEWQAEVARPLNADPGPIDRDAVWAAKRVALEVVFTAPRTPARQLAFDTFRAEQGRGLEDFATWCAITEHLAEEGGGPMPPPDEVRDLSAALTDRITFHCWLQWIADTQLEAAQRAAIEGGMRVGVMHDLAVGAHPRGADAWALPEILASGVSVGAPPDMYNQQGQDWAQPPLRPDALARAAYHPFRDMVRTVLRHAGGIRVDHVIGLFRLWWIPEGMGATAGAYVRYDHEALIGILCLEAHRAGAIVIGEDLGTLEPWVRDYLTDRGVLGTSVLWFERDEGGFTPPERYRQLALATITTHDLPPTAGYLAGEHVELRERLGLLNEPVVQVRGAAEREAAELRKLLRDRGLLGAEPSEREVIEAMHRLLLATPSVLIGVSLADAVGERRAQNQPGTVDEYPNWRIPLADSAQRLVTVESLFDNPRLRSLVAALR